MKHSSSTRRDFLKATAATAALAAFTPADLFAADSGYGGNKIPVGLQMYSVRNDCLRDLEGTLKAVAKIGYKGIELAPQGLKGGNYTGTDAKTLRKMLDDVGLKCCGAHTPFASLQAETWAATSDYNKILGNPFLIIPSLPQKYTATKQGCLDAGDVFSEIADKIKSAGQRVGYHNHTAEFKPIDGEIPFDLIFNRAKKEVIIQCDIGHLGVAGVDPVATIKRFPGRIATVHVKGHSKTVQNALVGEDELAWKEIFNVCETVAGTEWYVVEYEGMNAPLEKVGKIFETLHGWGKC